MKVGATDIVEFGYFCVRFLIPITVLPAKSDCDVVFCLQLFSITLTCTLHLS